MTFDEWLGKGNNGWVLAYRYCMSREIAKEFWELAQANSIPVEKRVMLNLASIKEEFSKWLIKIKNDAGQYRIMGYDFYNEKILVERSCGMEWVELSKCKFISKVST